jgi:hypothetical protein
MNKLLALLLILLLPSLAYPQARDLVDSESITWDYDTPGELKAHVVESFAAYWNAAAVKKAVGCSVVTEVNINSGPPIDTFTCPDADASIIYGSTLLPVAITTLLFTLSVSDVDSGSQVYSGAFSAQCRANDAAMNNTWGTSQSVSITMATANDLYTATSAAVTPNGSPCAARSLLLWRFVIAGTGAHTDDGDARFIGIMGEGS